MLSIVTMGVWRLALNLYSKGFNTRGSELVGICARWLRDRRSHDFTLARRYSGACMTQTFYP